MSDLTLEGALLRDRWIVGGCLALLVALAGLWLWRDTVAMARWDESMAADFSGHRPPPLRRSPHYRGNCVDGGKPGRNRVGTIRALDPAPAERS
jgi:hypothetical protein